MLARGGVDDGDVVGSRVQGHLLTFRDCERLRVLLNEFHKSSIFGLEPLTPGYSCLAAESLADVVGRCRRFYPQQNGGDERDWV